MTKIQRILAAIRGAKVDKIPKGEFYLEDDLIARLLQIDDPNYKGIINFKAKVKAYELLGLDALVFSPNKVFGEAPWAELKRWREQSDFFLFALVDGPFQGVSQSYSDFTTFLMDTMREKEIIADVAREVIQRSIKLGLEALRAGAHGILIADDIAYNQGLFVSPSIMRKMFFPYLKELLQALSLQAESISGTKVPVFFHSDGNILLVLEDLMKLGFDGIHSLEPVMDMEKVREATEDKVCLMGGFDLGWFDSHGVSKANELLNTVLPGGRYIFGSSAGILDESLQAPNVLKVYRFINEYKLANTQ